VCYTSKQLSNTLTVRLPEDLPEWLDRVAQETGTSRGAIIRMELEKSRKSPGKPFLRLAGAIEGPANLRPAKASPESDAHHQWALAIAQSPRLAGWPRAILHQPPRLEQFQPGTLAAQAEVYRYRRSWAT
jgi:hypothetical protein